MTAERKQIDDLFMKSIVENRKDVLARLHLIILLLVILNSLEVWRIHLIEDRLLVAQELIEVERQRHAPAQ